jgi:sporulation protein YlmC with PRC-barrel domain
MRLGTLLGLPVRTTSGKRLGHVHDIRVELGAGEPAVTGLLVGRLGLMSRLGLGAREHRSRLRSHDVVSWDRVVRADRRGVVIDDESSPG